MHSSQILTIKAPGSIIDGFLAEVSTHLSGII